LRDKGIEEIKKIPNGAYSGLRKNQSSKIFFYYRYGEDFHLWYLYDLNSEELETSKTEILKHIACGENEKTIIPDFRERVYEANRIVTEQIERTYRELEIGAKESGTKELSTKEGTKFVKKMIEDLDYEVNRYLEEYPGDVEIEDLWNSVRGRLLSVAITKRRERDLRRIWKSYKRDNSWKGTIGKLNEFLTGKGEQQRTVIEPFDSSKLRLIAIDFIS